MKESEFFIRDFLQEKYGIILVKIKESSEKSPDFECIRDGKRIFVCELKAIEYERSEAAGWKMTIEDGIQNYERDDNAVSRVIGKISKAHKQLYRFKEPRVIIFLNKDPLLDHKDLEEAFNGFHLYSNKNITYINYVSKTTTEKRLNAIKFDIDLYIWIDKQKEANIFFRYPTQIGCDLAHKYFGR